MRIYLSTLRRVSGLAAILAGVLFAVIQLIHPADQIESVNTSAWFVTHLLTFLFPVFGILGLTGIYLHQATRAGYMGLLGYLALFGAFVLMICFGFYEAFVAPGVVQEAPQYVMSALTVVEGGAGPKYLGALYQVNGVLYLLGGLVFGIATLRARVFSWWGGGLLILAIVSILSAAVLPFMARPSAVVFGVSFMALGVLLHFNISHTAARVHNEDRKK